MRVDSHHHLWNRSVTPQDWIGEPLAAIDRDFVVEDLAAAAATHVDRTVLVQTVCTLDETPLLLEYAQGSPLIGAVVGWVELTAPDIRYTLSELTSLPNGCWLRGIRHQVQGEIDPGWLERPEVVNGLRAVGEHGLVYEILTLPHQLPAAINAAEQLPEVQFVLDHLSKPPIKNGSEEGRAAWASDLHRLAKLPNVCAKISGLVTEADWESWTIADVRPVVETAIEAFGPERLMVGSDWPVCLLAASYEQVTHLHGELLSGLSESDRALVLGDNAVAVYRIDG